MSAIGILGGTFDPVHYGHLRLAQEAADKLRLSEVRFIPSGTPPHRALPGATAEDRLAMVRLAVAENSLFTVDERELRRSGPGYTVDTLKELREQAGADQPLVLLTGADAFLDLATWSRWHQLFDLAHIAVAYRPGFPVDTWQMRMPQPLAAEYQARLMQQPLGVHTAPAGGIVVVPIAALDISATLIRDSLRRGATTRYLLPDAVIQYIQEHGLYSQD
ncbi:MAG: nicotinate-nucleotide adenylyltransferase [Betaproteobacteria bacterium]|jgi:nicotinate-nucleotide adenylyltransferase|nr:nicotinate-nucleotide adenylyltransferase [Betaproteobacteria bacterium]